MNSIISQDYFDFSWLLQALSAGGMGIWLWDLMSDEVYFDEVQQELTGLHGNKGYVPFSTFFNSIHPEDRLMVQEKTQNAMKENTTFEAEFRFVRPDGKRIWLGARGDCVAVDGANYKHFAGVNWDITNMKEAEAQAEYVAKEMAHRIKNIIAMISGISRMTAKSSTDIDAYQTAFQQRLTALAGVNELILGNDAHRVSLEKLVQDTLLSVSSQSKISIETDNFDLNEKASQTLVLALNELATNALKYGALRDPDGTVDLSILVDAENDVFKLVWHEKRERPISKPTSVKGFGSQVLLHLTKATFKGDPNYDWHDNGLTYSCTWPASLMSAN